MASKNSLVLNDFVSSGREEKEEKNSSGDSKLKQLYFDAIFADTKTICAVCKAPLSHLQGCNSTLSN